MKKSVAMKWADALESGQYQKGKNELLTADDGTGERFCCLGVLCNLYAHTKAGKNTGYVATSLGVLEFEDTKGNRLYAELPFEVQAWAGMRSNEGTLNGVPVRGKNYNLNSLIDINDRTDLTFKQIAKIIRNRYKDL